MLAAQEVIQAQTYRTDHDILATLGVANRTGAAALASRLGLTRAGAPGAAPSR